MATIKKQSILGASSSYVGVGIGFLNKLVLFPIAFLNQQEYWGLLEFFVTWATTLGAILTLGVPIAYQRFIPGSSRTEKSGYSALGNTILLGGLFLFLLLLFTQSDLLISRASEPLLVQQEYFTFAVIALAMFLWEWGNGLLVSEAKAHVGIVWNTVVQRLMVTVLLLLKLFTDMSIEQFIHWVAASYALTSISTLVLGLRSYPVSIKIKRLPQQKEFFEFSGVSVLNRTTTVVNNSVDVLIAGMLLPLALVPVLAIAKYFNTVILIPGRAIARGSISEVAKAWKQNDIEKLALLYKKAATTGLILGLSVFSIIWIGIDHVVAFLPEGFETLPTVVWITAAGVLLNLSTGVNGHLINLSKFYKMNLWSNVLVLVFSVVVNYLLIGEYGLVGAAIGLALTNFFNNLIKVLIVWKKASIHPFTHAMFVGLLAFSGIFIARWLLPHAWMYTGILFLFWMTCLWFVWVKWKLIPEVYTEIERILPKWLTDKGE